MNKNDLSNGKYMTISVILIVSIILSVLVVSDAVYAAETTTNTVTNADGSVTTTTVTKNDDGTTTTVTRTEKTEGDRIYYTIKTVVTDADGKVKRTMTTESSNLYRGRWGRTFGGIFNI